MLCNTYLYKIVCLFQKKKAYQLFLCNFPTDIGIAADIKNQNVKEIYNKFVPYTIKEGDIISEIAMSFYGTSVKEKIPINNNFYKAQDILLHYNDIINPSELKRGQQIKLPIINDIEKITKKDLDNNELEDLCVFRSTLSDWLLKSNFLDEAKHICTVTLYFNDNCKRSRDLLEKLNIIMSEQKFIKDKPSPKVKTIESISIVEDQNTQKIKEIAYTIVQEVVKKNNINISHKINSVENNVNQIMKHLDLKNNQNFTYYLIRQGDTLNTIAYRQLGHKKFADCIYQSNMNKISNPNLIYYGLKLKIPNNCD